MILTTVGYDTSTSAYLAIYTMTAISIIGPSSCQRQRTFVYSSSKYSRLTSYRMSASQNLVSSLHTKIHLDNHRRVSSVNKAAYLRNAPVCQKKAIYIGRSRGFRHSSSVMLVKLAVTRSLMLDTKLL